jgi:hypothetical protein
MKLLVLLLPLLASGMQQPPQPIYQGPYSNAPRLFYPQPYYNPLAGLQQKIPALDEAAARQLFAGNVGGTFLGLHGDVGASAFGPGGGLLDGHAHLGFDRPHYNRPYYQQPISTFSSYPIGPPVSTFSSYPTSSYSSSTYYPTTTTYSYGRNNEQAAPPIYPYYPYANQYNQQAWAPRVAYPIYNPLAQAAAPVQPKPQAEEEEQAAVRQLLAGNVGGSFLGLHGDVGASAFGPGGDIFDTHAHLGFDRPHYRPNYQPQPFLPSPVSSFSSFPASTSSYTTSYPSSSSFSSYPVSAPVTTTYYPVSTTYTFGPRGRNDPEQEAWNPYAAAAYNQPQGWSAAFPLYNNPAPVVAAGRVAPVNNAFYRPNYYY